MTTLKNIIDALDCRRLKRSLQAQTACGRHKGFPIHFFANEREHAAMGGADYDWAGGGFYYESRLYPGIALLGPARFFDDAVAAIEAELEIIAVTGGVC